MVTNDHGSNTNLPLKIVNVLQQVLQGQGRRTLQLQLNMSSTNNTNGTVNPLQVEFVCTLALPPKYDANSLVHGAFATKSKREAYRNWVLTDLRTSNVIYFFEQFDQVIYSGNGGASDTPTQVPSPLPNGTSSASKPGRGGGGGGGGPSLGPIVGGVVAGFVVIVGLVFVFYKRQQQSNDNKKNQNIKELTSSDGGNGSEQHGGTAKEMSPHSNSNKSPQNGTGAAVGGDGGLTWEQAENPSRLNQEILVQDGMDDVSTIGDPFLYGQTGPLDEDERTATTSVVQSDTYNSLLGRQRGLQHESSFARSQGDATEFSAFTGMSRYLAPNVGAAPYNMNATGSANKRGLLGELGLMGNQHQHHHHNHHNSHMSGEEDETSFEQRLFPMEHDDDPPTIAEQSIEESEERSLDYSLPTALM